MTGFRNGTNFYGGNGADNFWANDRAKPYNIHDFKDVGDIIVLNLREYNTDKYSVTQIRTRKPYADINPYFYTAYIKNSDTGRVTKVDGVRAEQITEERLRDKNEQLFTLK